MAYPAGKLGAENEGRKSGLNWQRFGGRLVQESIDQVYEGTARLLVSGIEIAPKVG
jgi:hypothetical protein